MNNMKKALALVMSLALAASTFVVGAAYDDVPESHENRIAINLLGDLGVMVGDAGTNDFRPEGTLKRSEAAAIVYRLRTGKTNADSYVGTTGFSDVSDSHWASGYINYCVNQGIIAGYPDGTFKPDQDVTYAEYIKMVVCALNLQKVETTTYIDMNTGILVSEDKITTAYPTGYIALASDQQINEGIDYLNPNDKISRAEVAQGAYNAIFESYYKLDPKDADYVKDGTTYQHLAEQVFKLEKTTGVVVAYEDYTASVQKNSNVETGDSQSDNYFEVAFRNDDNTGWGTKNFEYADFDPELVGQEVYVWEKQRNTSSATDVKVVAVVATENNTVSTINTNDLKKDGSDLYYTDVNGKKQTLKSSDLKDTTLRLNGAVYDDQAAWDILKAVAEKRLPMDLTIIDNDDSTKSPSVISIKVYGETEITSVANDTLYIKEIKDTYNFNEIPADSTSDTGRDMYTKLLAAIDDSATDVIDLQAGSIDLLNDDDTANEKVSYYDGIAKEDKVMIYADVNGVIDIRKIEEKSGTVSAMSGSKFRVGDEEVYIVAGDGMKSQMTTNNGYDATAYIDPFTGYVVNVDEGVGSVEDYYYLHLLSNTYENANDFSVTAYDYEGNKVKLTFKDSEAESEFVAAMKAAGVFASTENDMLTFIQDHPVSTGSGSALLDTIGILDVNSKGEIVRWRSNNVGDMQTATYNKDNEYNAKTGYVNIANSRVEVKASSIVFGVDYAGSGNSEDRTKIDDVKTYVGSFPSITSQTASVDYYLKNGEDDLKAALVRDRTKGGNTEFANVIGYVVDERFEYNTDDDKGYAVYTIASKGEVKEYETEVTDRDELRDGSDSVKGKMIRYDLTTDNKIIYSDATDIDVMDGNVYNDEHSFKDIIKTAKFDDFSSKGICPGTTNIDEDELYFGIVVESKDGKYIQLTDENGNNIFVDYADDVKVHVLADGEDKDDKWDKVKGFDAGNIAISNDNNTTYAAVRIVDGDDINDARVTEVYAKTIKNDSTFKNIVLKTPSNPDDQGQGGGDQQGDLTTEVGDITTDFNTNNPTLPNNGVQAPTSIGGEMTLTENQTISLVGTATSSTATGTGTMQINGVTYTIVDHAPNAACQIALLADDGTYGASVTGPGTAQIVMQGPAEAYTEDTTLIIPMQLAQTETVEGAEVTKTQDFTVSVTVSGTELDEAGTQAYNQKLVNDAVAKAADVTKTADEFTALEEAGVVVDKIAIDNTANVTYTVAANDYVEASADGTQIVKKTGAVAPTADTPIEVTVNATLGADATAATATGTFTLTLKAPEATQPTDDELAQKVIDALQDVEVSADTFTGTENGGDIAAPATNEDGVTVTYAINSASTDAAAAYVEVSNGKIVKKADATAPVDSDVVVTIDVTATKGEATKTGSFELTLKAPEATQPTDDELAQKVIDALQDVEVSADTFTGTENGGDIAAPATNEDGVTVTYAINADDQAAAEAYVKVVDGKIVKVDNATAPVDADVTVTIDVTATKGQASKTGSFELTLKAAPATTDPEEEDLQKINAAVDSVAKVFADATTYFQAPTPGDVTELASAGTVSFDATANNVDFTKCELDFTSVLGTSGTATNSGSATGVSLSTSDSKKITFAVTQTSATLDGSSIVVTLTKEDLGLTSETAPATVAITINLKGNVTDDGSAAAETAATEFLAKKVTGDANSFQDVLNETTIATAAGYLTDGMTGLQNIKTEWEKLTEAAQAKVTEKLTNLSGTTVAQQMGKIAGELFLSNQTTASKTYKEVLNTATVTLADLDASDTNYQTELNKIQEAWEALKGEAEAEAWEGAQTYVASQLTTLDGSATAETVTNQIAKIQNAVSATRLESVLTEIVGVFDGAGSDTFGNSGTVATNLGLTLNKQGEDAALEIDGTNVTVTGAKVELNGTADLTSEVELSFASIEEVTLVAGEAGTVSSEVTFPGYDAESAPKVIKIKANTGTTLDDQVSLTFTIEIDGLTYTMDVALTGTTGGV